jgi:hypothetical protein
VAAGAAAADRLRDCPQGWRRFGRRADDLQSRRVLRERLHQPTTQELTMKIKTKVRGGDLDSAGGGGRGCG